MIPGKLYFYFLMVLIMSLGCEGSVSNSKSTPSSKPKKGSVEKSSGDLEKVDLEEDEDEDEDEDRDDFEDDELEEDKDEGKEETITQEFCHQQGLSWEGIGANGDNAATCGDPRPSWPCCLEQAKAAFPKFADAIQGMNDDYVSDGLVFSDCSISGSETKLHYFSEVVKNPVESSADYRVIKVPLVVDVPPELVSCPIDTTGAMPASSD